jgi:hypothetical protein
MTLSVLFIGSIGAGDTSLMRAEAMIRQGIHLTTVDGHPAVGTGSLLGRRVNRLFNYPAAHRHVRKAALPALKSGLHDVIWVDKGIFVEHSLLEATRKAGQPVLVHYNPDDPFGTARGAWTTFLRSLPLYDVHLVPRKENISEYHSRGAKHVLDFDRGFCPIAHSPPRPDHPAWREFAVPVAFTGSYEAERAKSITALINAGIPVTVRGSDWETCPHWNSIRRVYRGAGVRGDNYRLALGAPDITLHFLRHANRDEQDSRTFEIPACGGFMLAEWSPRHADLFQEDEEAVFFRSDAELIEKVRYYANRPDERARIAAAGRRRALESGYDYESRVHDLLTRVAVVAGRHDLVSKLPARPGSARPEVAKETQR